MSPKRFGENADVWPVELEYEGLERATGSFEGDPGVVL